MVVRVDSQNGADQIRPIMESGSRSRALMSRIQISDPERGC